MRSQIKLKEVQKSEARAKLLISVEQSDRALRKC